MKNNFSVIKGGVYCITGGGGFIGSNVADRIVSEGGLVRTIGNNIDELMNLKQRYQDKVEIIQGDIRSRFNINQLIVDGTIGVFHFAALKYVGLAEKNPRECVHSNIVGTMNVLDTSVDRKVEFVMATSTAASVQSSTVYGASKMIMEKLFNQYQSENADMKFRIVRLGNVLYSTGSVSQKWRDAIISGEDIIISNGDSTRFFMSIDEAVNSIFDCLLIENPSPYIPSIKSMSLNNLLSAMIIKYAAKDSKINVVKSVLREGENTHEKLNEFGPYSNEVDQYTVDEIVNII